MKDIQINSESSPDELDLIVVVERMVAFINRFFFILIIFPTIGIIAGFVLFLATQKLYVQDNPHGFIVQVIVKDTSILDNLQQGIVYGLENTEYVKERLITKR